jgi:hypothetical protein
VLAAEYYLPPLAFGAATRRELTPYDGSPFWGMFGLHLILVTTIYSAVLIAGDGFGVSWRLYAPVLVMGFVMPLVWPQVRSVPALAMLQNGWKSGLLDGLVGVLIGAVLGGVMEAVGRRLDRAGMEAGPHCPCLRCGFLSSMLRVAPIWVGVAVGLVSGWQRALWLAPIVVVSGGFLAACLCNAAQAPGVKVPLADEPATTSEIAADSGATPAPEAIQEEIHIISPPTEPIEPS